MRSWWFSELVQPGLLLLLVGACTPRVQLSFGLPRKMKTRGRSFGETPPGPSEIAVALSGRSALSLCRDRLVLSRGRAVLEDDFRLFSCARCGQQVRICRRCDHGNIYCSQTCSVIRRRESVLRAGARYQCTPHGARFHAARQQAWRQRQTHKVTHHRFPCPRTPAKVVRPNTPELTDGRVASHPRTTPPGRTVVVSSEGSDLLKAHLPNYPDHPRALLTMLEGLALWCGQALCVAISADVPSSHSLGLGPFTDDPGCRRPYACEIRPLGTVRR